MIQGRQIVSISLILAVIFLIACAPEATPVPTPAPQMPAPAPAPARAVPAAPAKSAWEAEWEKTLAAAKKEGRVVTTTSLSATVRAATAEGFKKAYGIPVESIAGRTADTITKILAERRAGLYNYDVYLSGSTSWLNNLKPASAAAPLESAFILPDVTDPELIKNIWWPGKLWWGDTDHTHLAPALILAFPLAMNTNMVKDGEIKSYRDLLNPKWQGKLLLDDPTVSGIGNNFCVFGESVLGWDYLVELAKAKPIIMRDQRLAADWLVHGKAALLIGPRIDLLAELMQLGAPVKGLIPGEGPWLQGGSTNLSMFNKPAHPSAAKIFINWYLSKEGQTIVVNTAGYQSLRLDVPTDHLLPEQVRQPGVKYFVVEEEKVVLITKPALQKKAQELFGPLLK